MLRSATLAGCAELCPHPIEEPSLSKVQQDLEGKASWGSTEQRAFLQSTAWKLPGERGGTEALSPVGIYETAPNCCKSKIVPGTQLEV